MQDQGEIIGFIGIGLMGRPIAERLLDAGRELVIWNRSIEKCEALAARGAEVADSIVDLTDRVDVVMLCLSDAGAVEEVVFGDEGIASCAQDDQLLIDLSSIDAEATREFARELYNRCGMGWVDAPVSGGVPGAQQGRLIVMAGGHEEDVERAADIMQAFSQRVTRMGAVGAGQVTKSCNQMMVGCAALAMAEMIALAERSGVDAELMAEALRGGFADSIPLQLFAPRMAVREFEPVLGRVATLVKDLDTAVELARESGATVPLTALAAQLARQHALHVDPRADWSTMIELYSD